jgi:hypothetical protein
MSPTALAIMADINKYIRGYPQDWSTDLNLNRILLRMLALADANAGGGGPTNSTSNTYAYTSADFSTATQMSDGQLLGIQYALFWNEEQRYLDLAGGEYSFLPAGGFQINVAGFDSATDNYHFVAQVLMSFGGKTLLLTSANFTTATDCPVATFYNKKIALFWNEGQKYLFEDQGDFSYLPGGGFRILLPGFDKSIQNYHFYASIL